ncbi:uricase [Laetiporus sulphureus 93-53]|uniref:Uricase n=1 Tax=Laetiporus sulphureus 93-53 TaxID=1314785 RepID=A0A165E296_9APHY|nr:uricase [Laetiporus sulphureus 93-53]KZT06105.1 uricase [Laetiporus sulphureus 93-53]
MSASTESYLSHARYGKDKVRVFRIVREGAFHHVVEYNVTVLVEGDIDVSYTKADNSVVVATDSMKNITYYLAKTSPHILVPERFAIHLGTHILSKYAHLHKAFVTVEKLRWARIPITKGAEGQEQVKLHPHSFYRDGEDKRVTSVELDATGGKDKIIAKVTSGITDLLVLKSTGSAFESFVRDEYTTLAEVNDRIFSTSIDLSYVYKPFAVPPPTDEKKIVVNVQGEATGKGTPWEAETVARSARKITLEVFAEDESASVQATLYKMAQQIIAENPYVESVTYTLPNKHYIPVDMRYIGVDNLTPSKAEVFVPIAAPSGLISATISRK